MKCVYCCISTIKLHVCIKHQLNKSLPRSLFPHIISSLSHPWGLSTALFIPVVRLLQHFLVSKLAFSHLLNTLFPVVARLRTICHKYNFPVVLHKDLIIVYIWWEHTSLAFCLYIYIYRNMLLFLDGPWYDIMGRTGLSSSCSLLQLKVHFYWKVLQVPSVLILVILKNVHVNESFLLITFSNIHGVL